VIAVFERSARPCKWIKKAASPGGLIVRTPIRFSLLIAVCSSVGAAVAQAPAFPTLQQGTPVMLLLDQTIDSAHSKMGQRVAFEVSDDVTIANRVVIPSGSVALGTVTQASRRGWTMRAGKVSVNIDAVRLPGGQIVALCTTPDIENNGSGAVDDAIATSLVPPPVVPHLLSTHRKDAMIPEGTTVRAFVRRDTVIVQQTASVSN
jgi:hypothetical protein